MHEFARPLIKIDALYTKQKIPSSLISDPCIAVSMPPRNFEAIEIH